MTHATFPNGMAATTEDNGPRFRLGIPTSPIGTLWPEWWPTPRPPAPPAPPPSHVQPWEDEECGCDVQDATTRPRDMERGAQQYKGRRFTVEDVPPYQVAPANPWARLRDAASG